MNDDAIRVLVIVVGWLTTGGGIAIITNLWAQKKKAPIDRETAMIANAMSANNSAVSNANEVTKVSIDLYKHVDARLSIVEKQKDETLAMFNALNTEFYQFKNFVRYWYRDLVNNWDEHRLLDEPPPMEYVKESN